MYWKQGNGEVIKISDMSEDHVKNTVRHLRQRALIRGKHEVWGGVTYEEWLIMFEEELRRRCNSSPRIKGDRKVKLGIKLYQYNRKNGVSTVIFDNDDVVMVKKSKDTKHCPYTALSSAIAKYMMGSQQELQRAAQQVREIKKEGR